jgi:hypothetical protein
MTYSDRFGQFYFRHVDGGKVVIFHAEDGAIATRLDADVYPVGSALSARHEHPEGITLTLQDALDLGIESS